MKKLLTLAFAAAYMISCSNTDQPYYPPPSVATEGEEVGTVQMWETSGNQNLLLSAQPELSIYDSPSTSNPSVTVDEGTMYQEIDGFGAALTGSSAYVIKNNLSAGQKTNLLNALFSPSEGAGISYLRLTIGASDFSLEDFTYDDMPAGQEDPDLDNFSIAKDEVNIIPVLTEIKTIAPEVSIMGSPWSAPAWMKTGQDLHGGKLEAQWYDTYANYFVKYIDAYAGHGITIDAITPQNEPLHESGYPSMRMEAAEQADFIKNSLGPAFASNAIDTKIIAYDHNFDVPGYPMTVFNDADASQYVAGSAFHAYAGNVSAMGQVHNAFPDKELYFTEISGGDWSPDFAGNLVWYTKNIMIGTTENWSRNALFWNLALNENAGPTNNGCQDCRGVVTVTSGGEVTKNEEYYTLAHFAKFVRPGAHRIASSEFDGSTGLSNVAFINTDGGKVMVILNESPVAQDFSVILGENRIDGTIEGTSVATITWQ
ncbi:MAG: glucan endo-1,6-beta-glucosidase [Cytophagaceae bacterium]|nr:glucan endo-1,6-beta-glucosidase [Cytophagaceae bacterium]